MARTDYGAILSTKIADTSQAIRDVNKTNALIAPTDWGTLIRAMKSASDYDNVMEQLVEETASGTIAHFTDGANAIPVKSLVVNITAMQSGTGDPSPSNVRPITGHAAAVITRTGANIWDGTIEGGDIGVTTDGANHANANRMRSVGYIEVKPNTSYNFAMTTTYSNGIIAFYDKNKEYVSNVQGTGWLGRPTNGVFTTPDWCYYIRFYFNATASTYNNDVSINYPSTDTSYHAYEGDTKTIDLGQEVFGGSLNVDTGKLTLTHSITTLLATDYWAWNTSLKGFRKGYAGYPLSPTDSNNMCSILPTATTATGIGIYYHDAYVDFINLDQLGITDAESWKTVLNNSNGVTFTLPLATPIEIQLTPEEVTTLLADNNIFADTGDVEVVYRANGQLYVAQH